MPVRRIKKKQKRRRRAEVCRRLRLRARVGSSNNTQWLSSTSDSSTCVGRASTAPAPTRACAVIVRSGGFFFDGYMHGQVRPHPADSAITGPARQVFGAERTQVHGGLVPPFPRYNINVLGSYATNWGPYAAGLQDPTLVGKLRVVYDPGLRDHPPPHLPVSVNIVRWRRL